MKKLFVVLLLIGFADPSSFAQSKKLLDAFKIIQSKYVDTTPVDSITEVAIKGMLSQLDPHSTYLTPSEVLEMNTILAGEFVGIGFNGGLYKDTLTVFRILPNSPSFDAGMIAGDKIISINGNNCTLHNDNIQTLTSQLRGKKGSLVHISLLRNGQLKEVSVIRNEIIHPSVEASYMLNAHTGYIYIRMFGNNTASEVRSTLLKLQKDGAKDLVLDLRDNGGGYVNAAISLCSQFLPKNTLIVTTKGKHSPTKQYLSSHGGLFLEGKVVVLINEESASASEITTGALQDWKRATVVGRRSFGKGLVQTSFSLPDKSQIKLTTARYFTPLGRCIQKPYADYNNDMEHRIEHHELTNADSTTTHGGIIPDVFVPADSILLRRLWKNIIQSDALNNLITKYYLTHQPDLEIYLKDSVCYIDHFTIPEEILTPIMKDALSKCNNEEKKDEQAVKILLSLRIKAILASYLWGMQVYHQINNSNSDEIKKAIQIIEN